MRGPERFASPANRLQNDWIAGADGCREGWVLVRVRPGTGSFTVQVVATAAELFARTCDCVLGLDVPIGLLDAAERGGRACDQAARKALGKRGSSVFSAPVRAALAHCDYGDALAANRASSATALGISRQCHAIAPKIREVDEKMTPALQKRVVEVHPELSFAAMAGAPLAHKKKRKAGKHERLELLRAAFPSFDPGLTVAAPHAGAADDDVLDAMAACWTAERVRRGVAELLPADAPLDARGLRMQIAR